MNELAEAVEEHQAKAPAGVGPGAPIVVAKDELLEILGRACMFTEEYGELIDQVTDTESWRQNALSRFVEHQERLDSGNSPLDRFGLILGLLQFLLKRGGQEHLSFKIPSRLGAVAEPGNRLLGNASVCSIFLQTAGSFRFLPTWPTMFPSPMV